MIELVEGSIFAGDYALFSCLSRISMRFVVPLLALLLFAG